MDQKLINNRRIKQKFIPMTHKNEIRKRHTPSGKDDKFFVIESLIFIASMVACAGVLTYVLLELFMKVFESITLFMQEVGKTG